MAVSDAFYNSILPKIIDLIERFGTTYEVVSDGVYDSVTKTKSVGVSRFVKGIVTSNVLNNGFDEKVVITSNKSLFLLPDANPGPEEFVLIDGGKHSLETIVKIKPADIVMAYKLDLSL